MRFKANLTLFCDFFCLVVVLGVWSIAWNSPFQFDDFITPLQDPASQSLSSWLTHLGHTLRPLSKLTYALENTFGLSSAPSKRGFQFAVMGANFLLLSRLLRVRFRLSPLAASVFALIWNIHPMQGEVIISLAGRPTLLAEFFLFLTWSTHRRFWRLGFLTCGILCKEVLLLLLLWEIAAPHIDSPPNWREKARSLGPFLLIPLLLPLLHLDAVLHYSLFDLSDRQSYGIAFASIAQSIIYILLPWNLNIDPDGSFTLISMILSALLLLFIYRRQYYRNEWLVYWLLLMLPLQGLNLKLDPLSLRSLSLLSLPGLLFAVSLWQSRIATPGLLLGGGLFLALSGSNTLTLARQYQNPEDLWAEACIEAHTKVRPCLNLAHFRFKKLNFLDLQAHPNRAQEKLASVNEAIEIGLRKQPDDIELLRLRETLRSYSAALLQFSETPSEAN